MATTGAGTLFPPNILNIYYSLIYDILKCITSDDIFLKYIENKLKIKVVWVSNKKTLGIKSLSKTGLFKKNILSGNDRCLKQFKIFKIS
jgi:hypothetical protein